MSHNTAEKAAKSFPIAIDELPIDIHITTATKVTSVGKHYSHRKFCVSTDVRKISKAWNYSMAVLGNVY